MINKNNELLKDTVNVIEMMKMEAKTFVTEDVVDKIKAKMKAMAPKHIIKEI